MRALRFIVVLLIVAALASQAGRFLVRNRPEKSDVILVLAGETYYRPNEGLELLRQGMAPQLFVDVESGSKIFDQRLVDIAQNYLQSRPGQPRASVCPILGLSTDAETEDARRCLESVNAHRVLLVTSEFHSRRALSIFRSRLPEYQFSIAAVRDPGHFEPRWWSNREWAKVTFDEWLKLLWWNLVDRWRKS